MFIINNVIKIKIKIAIPSIRDCYFLYANYSKKIKKIILSTKYVVS